MCSSWPLYSPGERTSDQRLLLLEMKQHIVAEGPNLMIVTLRRLIIRLEEVGHYLVNSRPSSIHFLRPPFMMRASLKPNNLKTHKA